MIDIPQAPTNPLKPIQALLPFDKWGVDSIGSFPAASGWRRFLLVAINYFTKWLEAEPLASITEQQVHNFIGKNLITHFDIPRTLISNNRRQFNSGPTRDHYSRFGIHTRFSAVSRPQTNAQSEAANKVVINVIKKSLEGAKGSWIDDLQGVLWSSRMILKETTGHSSFNLVYGRRSCPFG